MRNPLPKESPRGADSISKLYVSAPVVFIPAQESPVPTTKPLGIIGTIEVENGKIVFGSIIIPFVVDRMSLTPISFINCPEDVSKVIDPVVAIPTA